MRSIKFRAWDKRNNEMLDWIEINRLDSDGIYEFLCMIDSPNMVVMQHTGLLDKNGKEIYESDVCKLNSEMFDPPLRNTIFVVDDFFVGTCYLQAIQAAEDGSVEVIGNIYSNPDILGGDK